VTDPADVCHIKRWTLHNGVLVPERRLPSQCQVVAESPLVLHPPCRVHNSELVYSVVAPMFALTIQRLWPNRVSMRQQQHPLPTFTPTLQPYVRPNQHNRAFRLYCSEVQDCVAMARVLPGPAHPETRPVPVPPDKLKDAELPNPWAYATSSPPPPLIDLCSKCLPPPRY
jgi:hypothetical protein